MKREEVRGKGIIRLVPWQQHQRARREGRPTVDRDGVRWVPVFNCDPPRRSRMPVLLLFAPGMLAILLHDVCGLGWLPTSGLLALGILIFAVL